MCIVNRPIRTTMLVTFGLKKNWVINIFLFVFKLPQLWSRLQVYFQPKRRQNHESQLPCVYVCVAFISFIQFVPGMDAICVEWKIEMLWNMCLWHQYVTEILHCIKLCVSHHRHHMSFVIIMHSLNFKIWQGEVNPPSTSYGTELQGDVYVFESREVLIWIRTVYYVKNCACFLYLSFS